MESVTRLVTGQLIVQIKSEKAVKATYAVNLYQSSLPTDQSLKQLTEESVSAEVLDSGASRTVCGQFWMNCYLETLNESEVKDVETY